MMSNPTQLANDIAQLAMLLAVILFIFSGLALMVPTTITKRVARTLFISGILIAVLGSMPPEVFIKLIGYAQGLPFWAIFIVGSLLAISALQAFVALFIGWHAANSFAGTLTASMFRMVFFVIIAPLRALRKFLSDSDS